MRTRAGLAFATFASSCMLFDPLNRPDDFARGGSSGAISGGSAGAGVGGANGGAAGKVAAGGVVSAGGSSGGTSSVQAGAGGSGDVGNQAGAGGDGGVPLPCTSNTECNSDPELPQYCQLPERRCVPLGSSSCRVVGDPSHPRAIFFGAFAPFDSSDESRTIRDTYQLAFDEFMILQGLPPANARRPLVMVLCDSGSGPAVIDAAVKHLTRDVRVPAILAALPSADLQRNFESDYGADTFYLSPQKVSEELATSDSQGMVWNLLGRSRDLKGIYAALVRQFEAYVRTLQQDLAGTPLRVAAVTQLADADGNELSQAVLGALTFNPENLTFEENRQQGNALLIDIANQQIIDELVAFKPHLVISFAKEPFTAINGIAHQLEQRLVSRPHYLLSPWNSGDEADLREIFLRNKQAGRTNSQQRFFGIDGPSALDAGSRDAKNEYTSRLLSLHSADKTNFENFYDAFYYLVYAMFAGGSPITGPGTAAGMTRLYQGSDVFYVGRNDMSTIFTTLQDGRNRIYLKGALGDPTFDSTGGRVDTGSVYCFDNLPTPTLRPNVFGYNVTTDMLYETTPSPPCLSGLLTP
ncbi:MAG: hypothetical protein ACOY0T_08175 [Myxococcota bacterium]